MTEFQDSIAIETNRKRQPKSKSGKLLCAVRDKIVADMKDQVKQRKFHVPTNSVNTVKRLNARINSRLIKEDLKVKSESQLDIGLKTFQVRFVKPKQKRVRISNVDATTHYEARALVRDRWGKGTKIKTIKTF